MIKVYTDTAFMTPHYRSRVFPLLFDLCYIANKVLLEQYQLVDTVEKADVMIVPVAIECFFQEKRTDWLYEFIKRGNEAGTNVWVYSAGDYGLTLHANVYTFRLGGFKSKLDTNTFIMPSFIADPYAIIKEDFKPMSKTTKPKIGFVGHANGTFLKRVKEYLVYARHNLKRIRKKVHTDYQKFYPSSIKRYQLLAVLEKSSEVETNFIYRKKYRDGAKTPADKRQSSLAFFENIKNNPYTFCLRGAGNFSVRLYETLAMGRIPLIVDTDVKLPLDNEIMWKQHCVIATETNFIEKITRFHSTISNANFEQMQVDNRNLWCDYLNRDAYFSRIHNNFKTRS